MTDMKKKVKNEKACAKRSKDHFSYIKLNRVFKGSAIADLFIKSCYTV